MITSLIMAASFVSSSAHSKMIEDGSSFTGRYIAQDDACIKRVFNYGTGKDELKPIYVFQGTAEGLIVDARLQALSQGDPENAKPDSGVTVRAEYISSNEFRSVTAVYFEKAGADTLRFFQDYNVDSQGNITLITRSSEATPADNLTCHLVKQN